MDTSYISAVVALGDRIKLSNNGYLFAPTLAEVKLAKENPNIFKYTFNPANNHFPHKIEIVTKSSK